MGGLFFIVKLPARKTQYLFPCGEFIFIKKISKNCSFASFFPVISKPGNYSLPITFQEIHQRTYLL